MLDHTRKLDIMRTRALRLVATSFIAIALGLSLVVACYGWYLRRAARHLRDDLVLLTANGAGHSDMLRVAKRYMRFRVPASFFVRDSGGLRYSFEPNDPCVARSCVIEFAISNRFLSRFHLAKPGRFSALLIELDDRIARVEMALDGVEQGRGVGAQTTYVIPNTPVSVFDLGPRRPYSFRGPYGKPYMRTILSDAASSEQKTRATAFNMSCLTSVSGCNWPCDYLPEAWKDYRDVMPEGIKRNCRNPLLMPFLRPTIGKGRDNYWDIPIPPVIQFWETWREASLRHSFAAVAKRCTIATLTRAGTR